MRIAKAAPRGPNMPPRRLHDAPMMPPRGPKLPPSGTYDAPRGLGEDVNMASAMTPKPLVLLRMAPRSVEEALRGPAMSQADPKRPPSRSPGGPKRLPMGTQDAQSGLGGTAKPVSTGKSITLVLLWFWLHVDLLGATLINITL
eukprot:4712336-Pyramimonas_sp.AAC.1